MKEIFFSTTIFWPSFKFTHTHTHIYYVTFPNRNFFFVVYRCVHQIFVLFRFPPFPHKWLFSFLFFIEMTIINKIVYLDNIFYFSVDDYECAVLFFFSLFWLIQFSTISTVTVVVLWQFLWKNILSNRTKKKIWLDNVVVAIKVNFFFWFGHFTLKVFKDGIFFFLLLVKRNGCFFN